MRRAAFPLSVLLLAILVFLAWMHPAVLRPGNVGWVLAGEDRGQSAIGLAAYLRAGGPWPGLHQPLLNAPEGMPLLFTDSIPLLGLLLKPFAPWLPVGGQYVGLWYLLCICLQAGCAAALVRRYARDPLIAWLGAALLTLSPILIDRYVHASLCAQWLLLWALWIFVDPERARKPGWWAAILAVTALIHSYLLLMVLAFWGSALLPQLRKAAAARTAACAVLALIPAAVLMALNGVFDGPYAVTHTYGQFPAALDAWWNPANPDYTRLLPSSPRAGDGIGFEGMQYLGAGVLALLLLAAVQGASGRLDGERRAVLRRLRWLLPAFAAFWLVALGPAPLWRGLPLFAVKLSPVIVDALDPVRAAGRFLWPATYTLSFVAIVCATQWARAALILGLALALQVADLAPMFVAIRATSARADDPRPFTRTLDPRWAALIGNASAVEFEPAEPYRDLSAMEEIGWRAVKACRPLRYFYASRDAVATRKRIAGDTSAFAAGRLDPTRLYVLLDGKAPVSLAARVRRLDGIALIPPSRTATGAGCADQQASGELR